MSTTTTQRRWILAIVVVLLGQFAYRAEISQQQKSPVWDETIHMDYGSAFLRYGPKINPKDHPYPFDAFLALPLVLGERPELDARGNLLISSPQNLWPVRRMNIVLATLGLLLMSYWVMRLFGGTVALLFLGMGTLDPGWIAQARFATTDIAHGLGFALTALLLYHFRKEGGKRALVAAGAASALAILSKFSGLLLFPLSLLLLLGSISIEHSWKQRLKEFGLYCASSVAFVLLVFQAHWLFGDAAFLDGFKHLAQNFDHFLEIRGLHKGIFFMGEYVQGGSLLYFPGLLLSKTPIVLLILLGASLALPSVRRLIGANKWLFLIPLAFTATAIVSRINSGLRHMTPLLPFLWLLGAWVLVAFKERVRDKQFLFPAFAVLLFLEVFLVHPHYLPFTNALYGGNEQAHTIASNAASDWGQDLGALGAYLQANPPEEAIHLAYFGRTPPQRYGIKHVCRPCGALGRPCHPKQARDTCDADATILAISATCLHGDARRLDGKPGQDTCYSWLKGRAPDALIGGSILLFKKPPPK